jgi:hypothetical protein
MFLQMEGVLYKSHLFKTDWDDMAHFLKMEDRHSSLCGIDLKKKVRHNLEFVKECLELDKKMQTKESQSVPFQKDRDESPDVFLPKSLSTYKNNPEFAGLLICGLLRAAVARLSGEKRSKHAINVLNFYSMIKMSSWKLFEMVLANLYGPSLRQMQHVNAKQLFVRRHHILLSTLRITLKGHSTPLKIPSLVCPAMQQSCQK